MMLSGRSHVATGKSKCRAVGGHAYPGGMAFTWRYEAADGSAIEAAGTGDAVAPVGAFGAVADVVATAPGDEAALPNPSFPTQADAESWIGETWGDLLARGVESVSLLEDGTLVYGGMSLRSVT